MPTDFYEIEEIVTCSKKLVNRTLRSTPETKDIKTNRGRRIMNFRSNGQTGLRLPKLLKPKEAADVLAVSERTLWTLTDNGDVPAVRIGHSVRYDPGDLAAWIEQQKNRAAVG